MAQLRRLKIYPEQNDVNFSEGAELAEFSVTMVLGIEFGADCCQYPSTWSVAQLLNWNFPFCLLARHLNFCQNFQSFP